MSEKLNSANIWNIMTEGDLSVLEMARGVLDSKPQDGVNLRQEMLHELRSMSDLKKSAQEKKEIGAAHAFSRGAVSLSLQAAKTMTELVEKGHTPEDVINIFCTAMGIFNQQLALPEGQVKSSNNRDGDIIDVEITPID